ncbi:hypothetical protein QAD02_018424 [Eretmocerus hayati]|uniref:Uncharacterized protein n=1 Tax=Eretmocerus hayati TaxID=131215 RepID=A0ACC2PJQ4_9HYME|nr:hypothetical protein QAD02_018424 [Eretmocerus hayati]
MMDYPDVPYSAMAYQPIFARFTQLTAEQLEAIQQPPHTVAYLLNVDPPSPSTDSDSWDSSSVICLDPSESSETESVICLDTFDDSDSVICLDTFDDSDSVICLDTFDDRNSVICLGSKPNLFFTSLSHKQREFANKPKLFLSSLSYKQRIEFANE